MRLIDIVAASVRQSMVGYITHARMPHGLWDVRFLITTTVVLLILITTTIVILSIVITTATTILIITRSTTVRRCYKVSRKRK